jgi:hypothetical protein
MKVPRRGPQNLMGLGLQAQSAAAQQVEGGRLALLNILISVLVGRHIPSRWRIDQTQQSFGPLWLMTGSPVLCAQVYRGSAW